MEPDLIIALTLHIFCHWLCLNWISRMFFYLLKAAKQMCTPATIELYCFSYCLHGIQLAERLLALFPTPCSNWNAPPWAAPACICTSWPYQFTAPAAVGLIRSFLPECSCLGWCPSCSTRTRLRQCVRQSVSHCVCTYLFVALLRVLATVPRLIRVLKKNRTHTQSNTSVALFCSLHSEFVFILFPSMCFFSPSFLSLLYFLLFAEPQLRITCLGLFHRLSS